LQPSFKASDPKAVNAAKRAETRENTNPKSMPNNLSPLPYRCNVLIVDNDAAILKVLKEQLQNHFKVTTVLTANEAKEVFTRSDIDILVSDLFLDDGSGIELLDWIRRVSPHTGRVLLTGAHRLEDTIGAINNSRVHRIVLKPWRGEDLITLLRDTARTVLLERNHEQLLEEYRKLTNELENRVRERTQAHDKSLIELRMKNQILEKMALTDSLTGLPNRRAIDLVARKELLRRTRTPGPLTIGLIDADRFKEINTTYTLTGGDHVLTWLGQTLQAAIRATDALARVGGEEFMVVAPGTDSSGAEILAERIRLAVESQETTYGDQKIKLTISAGFAVIDTNKTVTLDKMRETAADALLEAKQTGRNRCVIRAV
jgi:diguanylate cyclase